MSCRNPLGNEIAWWRWWPRHTHCPRVTYRGQEARVLYLSIKLVLWKLFA